MNETAVILDENSRRRPTFMPKYIGVHFVEMNGMFFNDRSNKCVSGFCKVNNQLTI